MKITIIINDVTYKKASALTGISDIQVLVELGLETLIARESSRRLANLGGTEDDL